jgi:hypothetical protein
LQKVSNILVIAEMELDIVGKLWDEQPRNQDSILGRGNGFLSSTVHRPVVGSNQPPFQWVFFGGARA